MRKAKYALLTISCSSLAILSFNNAINRGRVAAQAETFKIPEKQTDVGMESVVARVDLDEIFVSSPQPATQEVTTQAVITTESVIDEPLTLEGVSVYTATEILNVRTEPSENGSIKYLAVLNTQVTIVEDLGEWYGFDYNGERLYIASQYTVQEEPAEGFVTELYEPSVNKTSSVDIIVSDDNSDEVEVDEVEEEDSNDAEESEAMYSPSYFRQMGVIRYNGWRFTYYSDKVLHGGGLDIPGRHYDENGYICDENDYICVASSVLKKGTVIDTPFGKQGKVYDSGCAKDVIDVYVHW